VLRLAVGNNQLRRPVADKHYWFFLVTFDRWNSRPGVRPVAVIGQLLEMTRQVVIEFPFAA
jgi:hypothetical protein